MHLCRRGLAGVGLFALVGESHRCQNPARDTDGLCAIAGWRDSLHCPGLPGIRPCDRTWCRWNRLCSVGDRVSPCSRLAFHSVQEPQIELLSTGGANPARRSQICFGTKAIQPFSLISDLGQSHISKGIRPIPKTGLTETILKNIRSHCPVVYVVRFLRNIRRVLAPNGNSNNTPATIVEASGTGVAS